MVTNWGMFWGALAGITRGVLYLVPHQAATPNTLEALPHGFLVVFGLLWLLAGIWALIAARTGRFGIWPVLAIVSLCAGWSCLYVGLAFVQGPSALSGLTVYVILAGLVWTKSRVAVVVRDRDE